VIEGDGRGTLELVGAEAQEIEVPLAVDEGSPRGGQHGRRMPLELRNELARGSEEYAPVPEIVARGQAAFRLRGVRLLDEGGHVARGACHGISHPDVAVAGRR
jgi:hypothetical protein